jgi:hypothetical protein
MPPDRRLPAFAWALAVISTVWGAADVRASDTELREILRRRLELAATVGRLEIGDQQVHSLVTTTRFYEGRAFAPAWIENGRPSAKARELEVRLAGATDGGLRPHHYHHGEIVRRLAAADRRSMARDLDWNAHLADLELFLTDAFILYGSHMLSGHVNPHTIDPEWIATPRSGDMAATLERALRSRRRPWLSGTLGRLRTRFSEKFL